MAADAPRAVVAALTAHAGVAAVCESGCWALSNIAISDAGKAAVVSAGAVRPLAAALAWHPSARGNAQAALRRLGYTSFD